MYYIPLLFPTLLPFSSPKTSTTPTADPKALAEMLKSPLLNPALLAAVNPQLLAVQLAQLQAGLQQLAAATAAAGATGNTAAGAEDGEDKHGGSKERTPPDPVNLTKIKTSFSPPVPHATSAAAESPLDLSGNKSPRSPGPGSAGFLGMVGPPGWPPSLSLLHPLFQQQQQQQQRFMSAQAAWGSAEAAIKPRGSLERMNEFGAKEVGGVRQTFKSAAHSPTPSGGGTHHHRQSAWQSQWKNKVPETSSDIFRCVCCRDSFPSLQALTTHMRETGHYVSPASSASARAPASSASPASFIPQQNHNKAGGAVPQRRSPPSYHFKPKVPPLQVSPSSSSSSPGGRSRDLLKEQIPMPRKLVRGQDVWLGKGEEQTKNILKCMYCGQSFRSLDMLTSHMQETKHYMKVMSQEQISSWKSVGPPPPSGGPDGHHPSAKTPTSVGSPPSAMTSPKSFGDDLVGSVLRCLACGDTFSSLKMLTDHIVKTGHQSPAASGGGGGGWRPLLPPRPAPPEESAAPAPPTKRPKSLPVKTLLEMERQQKLQVLKDRRAKNEEEVEEGEEEEEGRCVKCDSSVPVTSLISHGLMCRGGAPTSSSSSSSPPPVPVAPITAPSSSFRSILGSLESMVHHNFATERRLQVERASGIKSVDDFLHPSTSSRSGHHQQQVLPASSASPPSRPHTTSPFPTSKLFPPVSPTALANPPVRQSYSPNEKEAKKPKLGGGSNNPLAALQQLCDSAEKKPSSSSAPAVATGSSSSASSSPSRSSSSRTSRDAPAASASASALGATPAAICDPGSIVAFSWACNQAAVAGGESGGGFKCPFCETPFSTKGAYRHHLSKVHFMKEGGAGARQQQGQNDKAEGEEAAAGVATAAGAAAGKEKEDTSEAKYHKYAELAKQLSSQAKPPLSTLA